MKTAYLVLENGRVFKGKAFGAIKETVGEIVFTTAMTGYLEILTDPSYYGQIVIQTFPLIGNYGIIPNDFESKQVGLKAYIVKYPCVNPSNFRSESNIDTFLKERGITGLSGIDTRAVVKIIRKQGTMNGKILYRLPKAQDQVEINAYKIDNAIAIASDKSILYETKTKEKYKVAILDLGAKKGIVNALIARDCKVHTFAYNASAKQVLEIKPSGIVL